MNNTLSINKGSPRCHTEFFSYYSRAATIQGLLLFKGSYYSRAATIQRWLLFLWKTCQHQRQLEKVHKTQAIQWRLLEAVSGKRSLSVLLSVMETSRTTQTVLVLAWWPSSEIICIRACVCSAYTGSSCGYYSRAGFTLLRDPDYAETIRRQRLFEGGDYSKKYGICKGFYQELMSSWPHPLSNLAPPKWAL